MLWIPLCSRTGNGTALVIGQAVRLTLPDKGVKQVLRLQIIVVPQLCRVLQANAQKWQLPQAVCFRALTNSVVGSDCTCAVLTTVKEVSALPLFAKAVYCKRADLFLT